MNDVKLNVKAITNENAGSLLEQGLGAIRAGDTTIDLAGVETVDSAAVALLLAWRRAASEEGKQVTFAGVPTGITSLADLYGVDGLLQLGTAPA
jgi:phospholipid transport system transporter-binding protein